MKEGKRRNDRERGVYMISVAAELAGMHPQTLRIYERRGLLSPSRTPGNSRRYSDEDLATLDQIQTLTQLGVNLEGVRMILDLRAELDRMRQEMDRMLREIEERRRRLEARLRELAAERGALVPVRDTEAGA